MQEQPSVAVGHQSVTVRTNGDTYCSKCLCRTDHWVERLSEPLPDFWCSPSGVWPPFADMHGPLNRHSTLAPY